MSFDLKLENGDLKVSTTGDIQTVRNNEKLRQDVLKIIITPLGGNKAHPWYGSNVNKTLIGGVFDPEFTMDSASQQVKSALDNLQILQKTQNRTQIVTAAESILTVKDVYINQQAQNQRVINLKVSIITGALTTLDVPLLVKL